MKRGEVVTLHKLRSVYGRHALRVFNDAWLHGLPRAKNQQRRYQVVQALPDRATFDKMLTELYTTTVEGAVNDGLEELGSLAEELRSWHDAMPENLQSSAKGDEVEEAASALENIDTSIDVPDAVKDRKVVVLPDDGTSRADRCAAAIRALQAAIDEAQAALDELADDADDDRAALEEFMEAVGSAIDEAENVSFPGMY